MENEKNNIDLFYREALAGHKEVLGGNSWARMKWRLFWLSFKNYLIGFSALFLLGTAFYFGFFANNQTADYNTEESITYNTSLTTKPKTNQSQNNAQLSTPNIEAVIETSRDHVSDTKPEIASTQEKILAKNTENLYLVKAPIAKKELIIEESQNIQITAINFVKTRSLLSQSHVNTDGSSIEELMTDSATFPYHDIRKKVRFAVSFYAAPAYSVSSLSAANAYTDYLDYRNKHETGALSWSAGANIQVNIKNWYIQTGLSYSTYSDQRNYSYSFQSLDSINSYFNNDTTWGWAYDPPDFGKPIVLSIDSSFVPIYNEINEGLNTWKYIEIPLLVGYSIHANRFSFDIGTGFSYGFFLEATGNVPDLAEENLFTDLSGIEGQMNKHQINYILRLGLSYHITPQWSLIMKPYYKQNLQSVFNNNYPIDQRFKSVGIQLGLKVDL